MSRELIVSVNGREKKIAIVENDRVTEFYIERGEQNQGIVGNIYKGRVMRVLPGMQSAFVDIGLERDAFLYVTDFFDEEAEFERIVVDKSKKVDTEAATRAATEHIEQARIDREQHIEATHERVEPLLEVGPAIIEEKAEEVEEAEPRRRGRRGGRGRGRAVWRTHSQDYSLAIRRLRRLRRTRRATKRHQNPQRFFLIHSCLLRFLGGHVSHLSC